MYSSPFENIIRHRFDHPKMLEDWSKDSQSCFARIANITFLFGAEDLAGTSSSSSDEGPGSRFF